MRTFRQDDVKRACKGVVTAGLTPQRVEVDREGKIVVYVGEGDAPESPLAAWERENGSR